LLTLFYIKSNFAAFFFKLVIFMSENHAFSAEVVTFAADRGTPVSLYANLRQIFPESLLLECLEYDSPQTARSYLCADPILKFSIKDGAASVDFLGRKIKEMNLTAAQSAVSAFDEFQKSIRVEFSDKAQADLTGLFGYVGYSAIPFFEDIKFENLPPEDERIPDFQFALYRYVFRFDHFQNRLTAVKLREISEAENETTSVKELLDRITFCRVPEYGFERIGKEISNNDDTDFAEMVRVCQKHIRRGDVFQIVPSRKFVQRYRGDEFVVYRALRQINPSPFLFFFDYGSFSLFGSSPEAQILIRENVATLHPIAGTYQRGDSKAEDRELAEKLQNDPKESAEHVMLVDLARNDLSRHCRNVRVESFKEIEFFSHVIHLVSRVTGELNESVSAAQIFADTFPAGTLSGAPKYRAMEILNDIEPSGRSFYGGSVGFFGLNGECTQAIMIRSFLARRRKLIFQAGAGVVADSVPENETAEVRNKLAALRRAIENAETKIT
jgi:anthranilate synthase component 1